eukprot:5416356-Amphidinium_carterae.2
MSLASCLIQTDCFIAAFLSSAANSTVWGVAKMRRQDQHSAETSWGCKTAMLKILSHWASHHWHSEGTVLHRVQLHEVR